MSSNKTQSISIFTKLGRYQTSFQGKLTILVLVAILLPMLSSSVLLTRMLSKQLHTSFDDRLNAELKTFELMLKNQETKLAQGLSSMASDNTLQLTLELMIVPQLRKYLHTQLEVLDFASLVVYDNQGNLVASSGHPFNNIDTLESPHIAVSGDAILMGQAVEIHRNNEFLGTVFGSLDLNNPTFQDTVEDCIADHYAIWVNGKMAMTNAKNELPDLQGNNSITNQSTTMNLNGTEHRIRIRSKQYPPNNLTLGIQIPLGQQAQEMQAILWFVSTVVLSIFTIILIMLKVYTRNLVQPVTRLTEAAKSIIDGKTPPHLDTQRRDEFGRMALAFQQMVENLKQSEQELKNHRDHLEEKVIERTQELEAINDSLNQEIKERLAAEAEQDRLLTKVQAINKELSEFSYIVSHDLKAPLRGIQHLATWLLDDYGEQLDESGKEQLGLLMDRVDRMKDLIEGILRYSRAGGTLNIENIDLDEMVREIIDDLALPEHIQVNISHSLPLIQHDPVRITQVFQNLISNAVKYNDKEEGAIQIEAIPDDKKWVFRITDNGPGIASENHEKIFGIFQTLETSDEYESTGVGLSVVKKIIERSGGRIWVISEPDQGATFCFTLPRSPSPETILNNESSTSELKTS